MSPNVAQFLWEASAMRGEWLRLGGEAQWVEAFSATIRDEARSEEFEFATGLPPLGRTLFFQELLATHGDSIWTKLGALDTETAALFANDLVGVPLSGAFWLFMGGLDDPDCARWLDSVGHERAASSFAHVSAPLIRTLLDFNGSGLESLIEAWLQNHAPQLAGDEPLLMLAATNLSEGVRTPALARLRQIPLNLRVALRLVESGLPEAGTIARPYFEDGGDEWAMRALALADSPVAATRLYALELLARFPARWTPELLQSLAQHDDTRVQAFVAAQLERLPEGAGSEAITVFDSAIINARGRARRAKSGVQRRMGTQSAEEKTQLDSLLDAARNGAPRDRAWALQQLVRLRLAGADVPVQLGGAVARASS